LTRAENPSRAGDRGTRETARVAGAINAPVLHRDRAQRHEHRRLLEHPLSQIRVQAHAYVDSVGTDGLYEIVEEYAT